MKIWEARRKWEEMEVASVEEWRSLTERKARAEVYADMKEMARRAGYKDAGIIIKENGWSEREDGHEENRWEWAKEKEE